MTMSNPRIGADNLLHDNRLHLRASTELDADSVVGNIADWTGGRYWKPTLVSTPPATEHVFCYPLTKTNRINVPNWYFRDWTAGASAAPDNWTLSGASAAIAQNSTAGQFAVDQYSAKITRAGADAKLVTALSNHSTYRGKRVTYGAWVYATVASRARLIVDDGSSPSYSSYHTGGSSLEFLTVTHEFQFDSTKFEIGFQVNSGDTSASFDGGALYFGTTVAETPHAHAVTYLAGHDHNLGTGHLTLTLESSDDPADWSSPATRITVDPTTDVTFWSDISSVSKSAWRLVFTPDAAGSAAAYMAVASFGTYVEFPKPLRPGFDPYARTLRSEMKRTKNGPPIQRSLKSVPIKLRPAFDQITEAFITGDFKTFWDHAGDSGSPGGLPFFFQWDDGDHGSDTFFCSLPENARKSAPLDEMLRVKLLRLEFEAVAE